MESRRTLVYPSSEVPSLVALSLWLPKVDKIVVDVEKLSCAELASVYKLLKKSGKPYKFTNDITKVACVGIYRDNPDKAEKIHGDIDDIVEEVIKRIEKDGTALSVYIYDPKKFACELCKKAPNLFVIPRSLLYVGVSRKAGFDCKQYLRRCEK